MPALVVDFSYSKPSGASVKASGYVAGIGYLSSTDPAKNMTPECVADFHANGLGIALVWETTAQASLNGAQQGATDGAAAAAQAFALGYPTDAPLFVNVGDFVALVSQIPVIAAYYTAFKTAARGVGYSTVGGYATAFIIDQLVAAGCSGVWWQNAMDDSGESGSVVSPNASLYQRVTPTLPAILGASYDEDVVVGPMSFWEPAPAPSPPSPPTPPTPSPGPQPRPDGPDGNPFTPLATDGIFGPQTTKALQWKIGVTPDGIFGPISKEALQRYLGVSVDGIIGPQTVRALQGDVGVPEDGEWGPQTTRGLQYHLNTGRF